MSEVNWSGFIEVFRNSPPGSRCEALIANAYEVKDSNPGIEVAVYDIDSERAADLGVEEAPSVMVNGKILINGMASTEGLMKSLEEAQPEVVGLMFTRAPGNEEVEALRDFVRAGVGTADFLVLFLLNDGVWLARENGPLLREIGSVLENGEVLCVEKFLKESGIGRSELVSGVEVIDLEEFVDRVFGCGQVLSL